MQSGISASQDLHTALKALLTTPSHRGLLATITSETITPGSFIPSSTPSFQDDLQNLSPHLTPTQPLYIFLRLADDLSTSDSRLVAITYVPNAAPVRQKMLFASTRLSLLRDLGGEKFAESLFVEKAEELSAEGWRKHVAHTETVAPLTAAEQESRELAEQEALESSGTAGRGLVVVGRIAVRADEEVVGALGGLEDGTLVQLRMDMKEEVLKLCEVDKAVDVKELASRIHATEPRFSFYRTGGKTLFVSTCPSGSRIKERMLFAASRGNVIALAEKEGVKVDARIEAGDPAEVGEKGVMEELGLGGGQEGVEVKSGFKKPKRPGRR
ncbi:twinfilin-1 [Sporormia fimetaria CBS 119925]|uniref:Twinfilin-1 n=1 Tax=Sporormia fimetaria CBS 119925 TaxID=1340428 RepID=A0A6A6VM80_9PLEO|nr:twinfilin-1 [Sporormia fimetaria CBS 119925]